MIKNWIRSYVLCILFVMQLVVSQAQQKISLENIWLTYQFYPEMMKEIRSMNDGKSYTVLENNYKVMKYDYKTGENKTVIVSASDFEGVSSLSGYHFSKDESKILLTANEEPIYRRSSQAEYYVYDILKKTLVQIYNNPNKKVRLAEISPQNDKVAFMQDNNLYCKNLKTNEMKAITIDGEINKILNGAPDWVYEEEFGFSKAFSWSPDGKWIAYIKFDESKVKEYSMPIYEGLYPSLYTYKYPKAGEANSIVSVHIYNVEAHTDKVMNIGELTDIYIPRIMWTKNAGKLCITRVNRLQNKLDLLLADAETGTTSVMLEETNSRYINVRDHLTFLQDGLHYLWTSERDGWNHIYLNSINGSESKQLTSGEWEIIELYGVDEKNKTVYFQSTYTSPLDRDICKVKLDGSGFAKISGNKGTNVAEFSKDFSFFINSFSDANTPEMATINANSGKLIRIIFENAALKQKIADFEFTEKKFFDFENSDGVKLYGYTILPPDFDSTKKYPVFMHLYGGPGMQEVTNQWDAFDLPWYQYLAQLGYVVACVDNRGTDARGEVFTKSTYMQMGKLEFEDQIAATKYLVSTGYVDEKRIGIQGWSYGGYMSSLCLFKAPEVFSMAIAVAPVTNWRYYDNIYTERYMGKPDDNPDGYDDNSPINFVNGLKGKYLLIHGTADDNVHFQNSIELVNTLVNANKQFDLFFYPNCDHGIYSGRYTRFHLFTKMKDFILENL